VTRLWGKGRGGGGDLGGLLLLAECVRERKLWRPGTELGRW
jgi:hypothetical protein